LVLVKINCGKPTFFGGMACLTKKERYIRALMPPLAYIKEHIRWIWIKQSIQAKSCIQKGAI
jgi:hypothetical protein